MSWQVKFFLNQRGDYPVKDFIEKLEKPIYVKILQSIHLIESNGIFIKPPYVKKIQDNIWELRISKKIQVRIFYCFYKNAFYLLHAFIKKSQKTPRNELKIALDRVKNII